jgi:hypothetical protein
MGKDINTNLSGKPIKNCFECIGGDEMKETCPLFYKVSSQKICGNRLICDNDWVKYLNGNKKFTTYTKMLDEVIKKYELDEIPIINIGKAVELSDKISQIVVQTISDMTGDDLHKSRLVLLTHGDFKGEINQIRELGYRGPVAIFSDDPLAKKYGKRMGADEICATKDDIYKVILQYIA